MNKLTKEIESLCINILERSAEAVDIMTVRCHFVKEYYHSNEIRHFSDCPVLLAESILKRIDEIDEALKKDGEKNE